MDKVYYVYWHLCPDGRAYIGVSTNPKRRWETHGCNYKDHPIFYAAIVQFGWENIQHKVLFHCTDKKSARDKEKKLANYYQYYGLSLNAGNGHSHPCSEKSKKAVSEMRKRTVASEVTREKIREANKRRVGEKYNIFRL